MRIPEEIAGPLGALLMAVLGYLARHLIAVIQKKRE